LRKKSLYFEAPIDFKVPLMGRRALAYALAILAFVAAFLILYQQYITFGVFFQIEDIHHESSAMSVVASGIGIIVGVIIASENK
jgi:hypothetical protein